jgi:hypothetical protein
MKTIVEYHRNSFFFLKKKPWHDWPMQHRLPRAVDFNGHGACPLEARHHQWSKEAESIGCGLTVNATSQGFVGHRRVSHFYFVSCHRGRIITMASYPPRSMFEGYPQFERTYQYLCQFLKDEDKQNVVVDADTGVRN